MYKDDGFIKILTDDEELIKEALSHADEETIKYWENKLNISQTSTKKEMSEMLIKLNIGGSPRIRPNGLLEVRSQKYGSTYGRTIEELEANLIKKIKLEKSHVKNRKKKIPTPLLSEFYYDKYLPFKKENVKQSTINGIQNDFNAIINGNFDKRLNEYTAESIESFLLSITYTRKRQKLRGTFNNMLSYAKQLKLISVNPMDDVSQVKHIAQQGRALSFKDQELFFDTLFKSKIPLIKKLYLIFVYLTGTRRAEAIGETSDDIDINDNVLHIPGTKTGTSDRYLPLSPLAKRVLELAVPTNNAIFPITNDQASHAMNRITKNYRLHDLRHTFGTIAVCVLKLDPKTVALYMGHTDIKMTLSKYTHPEQLDRGLFYNGGISEEEKIIIMRARYQKILDNISEFLDNIPKAYPNFNVKNGV